MVKNFLQYIHIPNHHTEDFPDGQVVKNSPSNAEEVSSIPSQETGDPTCRGQLGLHTATEPTLTTTREKPVATTKTPRSTTRTQCSLSHSPKTHLAAHLKSTQ